MSYTTATKQLLKKCLVNKRCLTAYNVSSTSHEKNTRRTRRSSKTMIPCEKTITHAIDDGNEKPTSACEDRFRFL